MASKKTKLSQDNVFFLKLLLFFILGMQWVWLSRPDLSRQIPLPIGPLLGLLLARNEHFKIDRKIQYAVLLVAAGVSFLLEAGVYLFIL